LLAASINLALLGADLLAGLRDRLADIDHASLVLACWLGAWCLVVVSGLVQLTDWLALLGVLPCLAVLVLACLVQLTDWLGALLAG